MIGRRGDPDDVLVTPLRDIDRPDQLAGNRGAGRQ
jgi:hypothetical protein